MTKFIAVTSTSRRAEVVGTTRQEVWEAATQVTTPDEPVSSIWTVGPSGDFQHLVWFGGDWTAAADIFLP